MASTATAWAQATASMATAAGAGYGFNGYGSYPVTSYGTLSGGGLYAPLYNRPLDDCYSY
jgi:hypothetical protein